MTTRLPIPGSDDDVWGVILNAFLQVAHNADGTLDTTAVANSGAEMTSNKGQPSGYAGLNSSSLLAYSQIPTGTAGTSNAVLPANDSSTTNSRTPSGSASGDLTGTYPSPTIAKLNGISLPGSSPSANQVLTANSSSTTIWSTPAGGVILDSTSSDITQLGVQAAGSIGKAADSGHVHPTTGLVTTSTTAGGDLAGTFPNPRLTFSPVVASVSSAYTIDWNNGTRFVLTMTSNTTFSFANIPVGGGVEVDLSGAFTPTFSSVTWPTNAGTPSYSSPGLYSFDVFVGGTINGALQQGFYIPAGSITATDVDSTIEITAHKGVASGYAPLDSSSLIPTVNNGTGTASSSTYLRGDRTWQAPPGVVRSINSVSTATAAGSTAGTDYIYLASGTTTVTLPTAVSNTNLYVVKNTGVATVTVATTSSQTIDGSTTVTMPVTNTSLSLISDNANWRII